MLMRGVLKIYAVVLSIWNVLAPVFVKPSTNIEITENVQPGTSVYRLTATDEDQLGTLVYTLVTQVRAKHDTLFLQRLSNW